MDDGPGVHARAGVLRPPRRRRRGGDHHGSPGRRDRPGRRARRAAVLPGTCNGPARPPLPGGAAARRVHRREDPVRLPAHRPPRHRSRAPAAPGRGRGLHEQSPPAVLSRRQRRGGVLVHGARARLARRAPAARPRAHHAVPVGSAGPVSRHQRRLGDGPRPVPVASRGARLSRGLPGHLPGLRWPVLAQSRVYRVGRCGLPRYESRRRRAQRGLPRRQLVSAPPRRAHRRFGSRHAAAAGGGGVRELEELALRVRRRIVRLAGVGGCFLGASLSCADLVAFLYSRFVRLPRGRLADPIRDYLLLSKGHDVPALYATLVELGVLDAALLEHHLVPGHHVYWHPNPRIAGVEFHAGSLGHLLSVGAGIAYDIRLRGGSNRVVVLLGDGELNEGSVWEALLVATALRLDNLVLVVDRNGFQANARTEELIPLEPLAAKFAAFGASVRSVDGHDFAALSRVFAGVPLGGGAPSVVIAHTVRGKGLPSIENRADR